jgi:hypothetical protein
MMNSYLFDAGWLFFALWGVALIMVSVAAFGRDLFPAKASSHGPGRASDHHPSGGRV